MPVFVFFCFCFFSVVFCHSWVVFSHFFGVGDYLGDDVYFPPASLSLREHFGKVCFNMGGMDWDEGGLPMMDGCVG